MQKFLKKHQSFSVNHSSGPFLLTLTLGTSLFVQTVLFPVPAFSQSNETYPAGDQEYFEAVIELEKDEAYKNFLLESVSYAGDTKVEYRDYKGVRPTVDEVDAEPSDNETDARTLQKTNLRSHA